MSKIKNGGLDQYGTEPFEQQQFGTADIEGVKTGLEEHTSTRCTFTVTLDFRFIFTFIPFHPILVSLSTGHFLRKHVTMNYKLLQVYLFAQSLTCMLQL